MENNEMRIHLDNMLKGINGMTEMLESGFNNLKNNMTTEQAKEFAVKFTESDIIKHSEKFEQDIANLKNELNID